MRARFSSGGRRVSRSARPHPRHYHRSMFLDGCSLSSSSLCVHDASLVARRTLCSRPSHTPSSATRTLTRRALCSRPSHVPSPATRTLARRPSHAPSSIARTLVRRTHPHPPRSLFSPVARTLVRRTHPRSLPVARTLFSPYRSAASTGLSSLM